ncbi:MAG: DUF1592 domain-containing protein [Myxococcota bacterium]
MRTTNANQTGREQHGGIGAVFITGAAILASVALTASCGGDDPCPPDIEYFQSRLWEPILATSCIGCHNSDGVARNSQFVLMNPDEDGFLEHNFEVTRSIAAVQHEGQSVLLLRPTGGHPDGHGGGVLFATTSARYDALAEFAGRVNGDPNACVSAVDNCADETIPGPRRLRRLSRSEFDNTISDLLNIDSDWGAQFAPDVVVGGFDNNADALTVTPLLADQLRGAAEEIAELALPAAQGFMPCTMDAGDRECAGEFIDRFGERTFRRELTESDRTRYLAVFDLGAEEGFARGVELVISAMLQSPHFLYRRELGVSDGNGRYNLTSYEIASELSYFLWGTMPDDELFEAARSDALIEVDEIEAQARRMLASPKAKRTIESFSTQWLDIERVTTVPKDGITFPEFTPEIRASMAAQAAKLLADVMFSDGATFADMLLTQHTIVDERLATFYGISLPAEVDADGFGRVTLPQGQSGGILTMGAVLATHARANDSSPVHRGKLIRERLLCQELAPPPPGVNAELPELEPGLTTRERYIQHSADSACSNCHRLMDPIGFSFENFDGIGRWRDDEDGLPIDVSGEILQTASSDGTFNGVNELAEKLADSRDVQSCFARQWVRFAYGSEDNDAMACTTAEIESAFLAGDLDVTELIISIVRAPHFRTRVGPAGEAGAPNDDEPAQPDDPGNPGNGGDGGGDNPPDGLTVEVRNDSSWETGYCNTVIVSNDSDRDIDWEITLTVEGTINDNWNSNLVQNGNQATFSGVEWNNVVGPGQSAEFGFCAQL